MQLRVGGQSAGAVVGRGAQEIGADTTGFRHEDLQGGDVPGVHDRFSRDVEGSFGDHAVLEEVPEGAVLPALLGQA